MCRSKILPKPYQNTYGKVNNTYNLNRADSKYTPIIFLILIHHWSISVILRSIWQIISFPPFYT